MSKHTKKAENIPRRTTRSPERKARDRAFALDRRFKGDTLEDIAKVLNIKPSTVLIDVQEAIGEYLELRSGSIDSHIANELARLDLIEKAAWQGFEDSKKPETINEVKATNNPKAAVKAARRQNSYSVDDLRESIERKTRTKSSAGDPRFLQVLQRCIEQRAVLLNYSAESGRQTPESYARRVMDAMQAIDQLDRGVIPAEYEHVKEIEPPKDIKPGGELS